MTNAGIDAVLGRMEEQRSSGSRLSVQPRGAVLGGLGLAMLVAGLWRVDGVLASLGLAAWCLLGLAWLLAWRNPAGLVVTLHGPRKVVAGSVFPLVLTLVNRNRLMDAFGVRVELNLSGKIRVEGRASWVAAGSAADLEWRTAVPERGWVESHRLRFLSDFPFGLFEAERVVDVPAPLMVLPRPVVPRGLRFSGALMDSPESSGMTAGDGPGETRGLREWRPGDSPRRILWPATLRSLARGAAMVVRETDPPGFCPRRCVVVFHSFGADGGLIRPDRFERAIELTAGTLRQLRTMGMPARLIADFDGWTIRPASKAAQVSACMEVLAKARRAADTEAHDLARTLAGLAEDDGWILISDMPLAAWREMIPPARRDAMVPQIEPTRRREVHR